jgi:hypothetical protein
MKTAINQLIKWIWLDFYPSELISVEQMNKIESQAKNLIEPEKIIIKAFNSGRLAEEMEWIKQQKNISTKPLKKIKKNLRWYSSFIIFDKKLFLNVRGISKESR